MIIVKRRKISPEERENIYLKYNKHCAYCGIEIKYSEMEVDHLIPIYHFEMKPELKNKTPNCFENLMPSCRSCNRYKDTYDIETFRKVVTSIPHKLRQDHKIFSIGERYGLVKTISTEPVQFYFEQFE